MRHRKKGKKLSRDKDQRKALFKNLARSFFLNQGKLETTLAKAKAVQSHIEKMITRAKKGDLASRRWLYRFFQDKDFVNKIVENFGKKAKKMPGGYTRLIKLKKRRGDAAIIARLELIK
jgi:large subunit ribosomal protein L17